MIPIIHLDITNSTNDFLKRLLKNTNVENFTVVMAHSQTNGRGQTGTKWISESGKNLIFSILINKKLNSYKEIFNLNVNISVAIYESLNSFEIPNLSIKWPNDIMSSNKKIAGILIENIIKPNEKIISIIGVGLNVNQTNFDFLPQASSLKKITGKDFNLNKLIINIVNYIKKTEKIKGDLLWEKYNSLLFKKNLPVVFEDKNKEKFMAIIKSVSKFGKLQLLLENDIVKEFDIKEISMKY